MRNKRIETVSREERWTGEKKARCPGPFSRPAAHRLQQGESTRIPAAPTITVIDPLAVT
jgi:hypothetical protein